MGFLLLADFIEKFRRSSLKNYGLCSSRYLSVPALSWDAMLKMRKVKLELVSDAEIYLFFDKGLRDRVSYISKRYSKTSNSYLKSYDLRHIIYLDGNNFYCYTISKFFPTGSFKLIDPMNFDSNKYSSNISKGCVLEVDLEYP